MTRALSPRVPSLCVPTFRRLFAVIAALGLITLALRPAAAEVRIDITQGVTNPMPIAVTSFFGDGAGRQAGQEIASVIAADLERSGIFRPINPTAFLQDPASLQSGPRFADWRILDAQALVSGAVAAQPDGRLRVEFRLWDVVGEQQIAGSAYFTQPANWRRVAHIIADAIFLRITGEQGFFDTRIVYVSETGPATNRIKRLAIMDQDGANHRFLTDSSALVLTPRFSPTAQEVTYMAYYNNRPRVYLFNIDSGRQEVLGDFPGMTFAPRFSPDGNRVIMSMAQEGNSDIYVMDLRTRQVRRLTNDSAIDTSPSYSPDGSEIVFESDRGGTQQIYIMSADGSNVRRISYGDGRYGGPVWSPRGDLIAFTNLSGGQFHIGVIRPDGTGERMLVNAYHAEGPTWAPNGRYLMYFSESSTAGGGRTARIYAVDLSGHHTWSVPTPLDGSDPAWSPLIP